MTITDQIKILKRKIKQNESQYDLDREAAKISVLSAKNLDKYELLTGEDLDFRPSTVEQAKFEYSPLDKIFSKGVSEEDKKEGLFKRLENIKDKNEELINRFSTTKASKNKINNPGKKLVYKANHSFAELRNIDNIKKLSFSSLFNKMKEYHGKIKSLDNLKPRTKDNEKLKQKVLNNVADIYNELYYVSKSKYNKKIDRLTAENKKKFDYKKLRLSDNHLYLSEEEQEKEQEKQDEKTTDPNEFNNWIIDEEIDLDEELFKKHFNFQKPSDMLMLLNKKDKTKNNELVKMIISGLKDLKEEIKKMSEEENKIEDPEWIV